MNVRAARQALSLLFLALFVWSAPADARDAPAPPCGTAVRPAFPEPGAAPVAKAWGGADLSAGWAPPACTGWTVPGARVLVALAASFRYDGDANDLLARFGAVSALRGIRYWSVTRQAWQTLVTDAAALEGPDVRRRRPDFSVGDVKSGRDLFLALNDGRSSDAIAYRLRLRESSPSRIVIAMENVSAVRAVFVTLFDPGDIQSVYFLEKASPGVWRFFALSRVGLGASSLAGGHEASYVNRAVAFYRHFAGIPTDQDPPAAP